MASDIRFDPDTGDFDLRTPADGLQKLAHRLANHGKVFVGGGPYSGVGPYYGLDRHTLGGGDEINGDHLGIDYVPVHYTPTPDGTYSSDSKHLAAHLHGIDDELFSTGHFLTVHVDPNIATANQVTGKLYNNLPDAIAYVNTGASSRTMIQLMPGTYTISSSVLTITEDCIIRGAGIDQTILDFTVLPLGVDYAVDFVSTTFAGIENLTMYVDSPLLGAVRFTMDSTVKYLSIQNFKAVKTSANDIPGIYAVKVDLSSIVTLLAQVIIRNVYINCTGMYWQYGMQLLSGSVTSEEMLEVDGVQFEAVYTTALYLDGWSGSVRNITCHNCGRDPTPFAGAFANIAVSNSPRVMLSNIVGEKDSSGSATTGYSFLAISTSDGAILSGLRTRGTAANAWYYVLNVFSRTLMAGLDIYQNYSGGSSHLIELRPGSDNSSITNFSVQGGSGNLFIEDAVDFVTIANGVFRGRTVTHGYDCRFNSVHFEDTITLGEPGLGSDFRINNSFNGCHFSGSISGWQGRATFSGCHMEPNTAQRIRFYSDMTNAILTGCAFKPALAGVGVLEPSMVHFECPGSVVGCIQYDNPVVNEPTWAYIRFAAGAEGVIANNTFMSINSDLARQGSLIDVSAGSNENVAIANNVCDAPAGVAIGTNGITVAGTANTVVTVTGNIMPTITVSAPVPSNRSNNIPAP